MPRLRRASVARLAHASRPILEALETRSLLSATLTSPITAQSGAPSTTGTVELSGHFDDPALNSVVHVTSPVGDFDITLFDSIKPITVANFLKYVRQGRYDGTIIHRSSDLSFNPNATPTVLQGGGYGPPNFNHIATDAPIVNEFNTNQVLHNTIRTISMAKTSDPDSATSEFFINLTDNSSDLDSPSNSGGFTVFGEVTQATYASIQAIAALPRFAFSSPFSSLPLRNYTQQDYTSQKQIGSDNLVNLTASVNAKLTYQVASSDPTIATPTITGNKLNLAYGSNVGTATITVIGTDGNGQSVQSQFTATNELQVTLGTGGSKTVNYTDADGTVTTISYKGTGSAKVTFSGTGLTQTTVKGRTTVTGSGVAANIVNITGSNTGSSLSIAAKGGDGRATVAGITSNAALKSISGKAAAITGNVTIGGALGSLAVGSLTSSSVTIGGSGGKGVAISAATLTDTSISSGVPIRSLAVTGVSGTDAIADTITAPSIGSISTKNDFTESLNVNGTIKSIKIGGDLASSLLAQSIGSLAVSGSITGSTITLTQTFSKKAKSIGSIKAGGAITNSTIRGSASIGSVTAASMNTATIFAGVTGTALPTTTAEIPNATSIASVKLTGAGGFANSKIAASSLGKLTLGLVTINNGGTAFGVSGDKIAAITGNTSSAVGFNLKKLDTQADFTAQSTGLDLQDMRVILL